MSNTNSSTKSLSLSDQNKIKQENLKLARYYSSSFLNKFLK
jgi:hypothetical protein